MEGSLSSICLICGLTDAAASTEDRSMSGLLSSCCMACCHIGFCTQGTSASYSKDARRQKVYRVTALPIAKSVHRHSKMYLEAASDENTVKTHSHVCSVHGTSIFLKQLTERTCIPGGCLQDLLEQASQTCLPLACYPCQLLAGVHLQQRGCLSACFIPTACANPFEQQLHAWHCI